MLGIIGVIALVLGAFIAGGGAFDWEFLFSDGYREHAWVRSTGRDGARGLMMLLGGLLAMIGFVSQVVDAASQPSLVAASPGAGSTTVDKEPDAWPGRSTEDSSTPGTMARQSAAPRSVVGPTVAGPSVSNPRAGDPAVGKASGAAKPAPGPGESFPPSATSGQAMTVSNPDVVVEENQTLVILQYRFEAGHRPLAGSQYHWIVSFMGVAHEIAYDAEAMQNQGQLTHLFSDAAGGELNKHWSTWVEIETAGRRKPISNTLEINGGNVRSRPLATTP